MGTRPITSIRNRTALQPLRAAALLVTVTLVASVVSPIDARQNTGSLFGIITDVTGEGLPGVRIVVAAEGRPSRTAVTNPLGRYTIESLPAGKYRVEAHMARFETKVGAISVVPGQVADWSGAMLTAPQVFDAPVEPRVMKRTSWDAVDCGRRSANAEPHHLEKSAICIVESAKQRRPAAVIVQSNGARSGYGLLTGTDGVIQHFRYGSARLDFSVQPCDSPRVVPDAQRGAFVFACQ